MRLLNNPGQTGVINYSKVWDRFATVFGRQSLKIVPFSNLVDASVDPFDHFCRVILGLSENSSNRARSHTTEPKRKYD